MDKQIVADLKTLLLRWLSASLLIPLLFFAALFLSRGSFDWWQAWILFIFYFGVVPANLLLVMKFQPQLLGERISIKADTPAWDRPLVGLVTLFLPTLLFIVAGLDWRFGWAPFSSELLFLMGMFMFVDSQILLNWAMIVNPFFAATVRIQTERGHYPVAKGPYRVVRHPGYLAGIIYTLGVPLALGSRWALVVSVWTIVVLVIRTYMEDETLQRELPGYTTYIRQVRYRLLPWVW